MLFVQVCKCLFTFGVELSSYYVYTAQIVTQIFSHKLKSNKLLY